MHENPTIPRGLCQCGCGQSTRPATITNPLRGAIKGQPQRFIRGHQRRSSPVEYVVDSKTGCWMWQRSLDGKGYGQKWNGQRNVRAHCWYYEQARGPIPDGLQLDHLCHTLDLRCPGGKTCRHRRCVNPEHLGPVTTRTNVQRGVLAKLTSADVVEIRRLAPTTTKSELARAFGVSQATVFGTVRNAHWFDPTYTPTEVRAKLTELDVREMRRMARTMTIAKLARRFGVSWHTANAVIERRTWKSVT